MSMRNGNRVGLYACKRAFTLVELLVVIGIIAVLVGILMPALGKARESAKRTQCASNFKQLAAGLHMYAVEYKGKVPIGTSGGTDTNFQNNYFLWNGTLPQGLGLLVEGKQLDRPEVYYCPTNIDLGSMYDSTAPGSIENLWFIAGKTTRAGFQTRPEYFFRTGRRIVAKALLEESATGASAIGEWRNMPPPGTNTIPYEWPTWEYFKRKAVISDFTIQPYHVVQGHRRGVNVLYGDQSVRWVPMSPNSEFELEIMKCVAYTRNNNPSQARIWRFFDRQVN